MIFRKQQVKFFVGVFFRIIFRKRTARLLQVGNLLWCKSEINNLHG